MLKLHLDLIADLDRALAEVDAAVGKALAPIRERARLLTTMPGISDRTAQVVVAEIGTERFPSPAHLISWAGLCPRNDESAGKRRSTRVRKSGTWLKTRRGAKKAILAVAASMLTAAYFMLRDGVTYRDLGPHHLDQRHRNSQIRRLLRRLHELGCKVVPSEIAQQNDPHPLAS